MTFTQNYMRVYLFISREVRIHKGRATYGRSPFVYSNTGLKFLLIDIVNESHKGGPSLRLTRIHPGMFQHGGKDHADFLLQNTHDVLLGEGVPL